MRLRSAILACLALTACSDPALRGPLAPGEPLRELVDPALRIPPENMNAHVYGSFAIPFGSDGPAVIRSGPANFPGHPPAGPGTCTDGLWINAQGKPTSGSLERPHPHCVSESSAIEIVLEPISACYSVFAGRLCSGNPRALEDLVLGGDSKNPLMVWVERFVVDERTTVDLTQGLGTIVAYAIDAATLRTTPRRIGVLVFNLAQYDEKVNWFAKDCTLDSDLGIVCLNRVITADYKPLPAPDGVGTFTSGVPGFLWFTQASRPYNYGG